MPNLTDPKIFQNITKPIKYRASYEKRDFTVTWKNWDASQLKVETVGMHMSATPPTNPTRDGYTFSGWDKNYSVIISDTIITAQYTKAPDEVIDVSKIEVWTKGVYTAGYFRKPKKDVAGITTFDGNMVRVYTEDGDPINPVDIMDGYSISSFQANLLEVQLRIGDEILSNDDISIVTTHSTLSTDKNIITCRPEIKVVGANLLFEGGKLEPAPSTITTSFTVKYKGSTVKTISLQMLQAYITAKFREFGPISSPTLSFDSILDLSAISGITIADGFLPIQSPIVAYPTLFWDLTDIRTVNIIKNLETNAISGNTPYTYEYEDTDWPDLPKYHQFYILVPCVVHLSSISSYYYGTFTVTYNGITHSAKYSYTST